MIEALYGILGLVLLFVGGEVLLKGSVSLALSFRISKLLVSAIIMGFGTSTPELAASLSAVLKGSTDIALGNIIGSNITNILLIVGVSAILCPIFVKDNAVRRDVIWMLSATFSLIILSWLNLLNLYTGLLLLSALSFYIISSIIQDRANISAGHPPAEDDDIPEKPYKPIIAIAFCVVGLAGLLGGAHLMLSGAIAVAQRFGISESVIGLSIIALGTSLPEVAMAIIAAIKKESDVIIGNILGSNIFNIFFILGVVSTIEPINVATRIIAADIWVMLAASLLLGFILMRKITIGRIKGAIMLSSYVGYIAWLYIAP